MPLVRVDRTLPDVPADRLFAHVADFERYPLLTDTVRAVRIRGTVSDWEVNFRKGILRWTEEDTVDPASRTIGFRQIEGDLARFDGAWRISPTGDGGSHIVFEAEFDLGMPSLAEMLDPVAERALLANVGALVDAFARA